MIYRIWLQTWAPETWMRDVGIEGRWWLLTSMLQSNRLLSASLGPSHNVTIYVQLRTPTKSIAKMSLQCGQEWPF